MLGKCKQNSSLFKQLIIMVFFVSSVSCTVTPTESDNDAGGVELSEPEVEVSATETQELPDSSEPRLENLPVTPEEHDVEFHASAPEQYTVVPGDTLWDLSNRFLVQPWFWPEIWYLNPQIEDPHLIYPGDVISIFYVGGKPYLTVDGGPRISGATGSERLSPSVRTEDIDEDPYAIPIQAIAQFIIRPRIVSKEELESAPYIVGSQENRLAYGSGDRVYVRGLDTDAQGSYTVFRSGSPLYDLQTKELLGYEAIMVGDAKIVRIDDPATFDLGETKREALRGDRLLPIDFSDQDTEFVPHAPSEDLQGNVISLFDAITKVGAGQVITVNLGDQDGIEKGHVFVVSQAGRTIGDPFEKPGSLKSVELPEEKAGVAMVFRTFEKVSYALIMDASRPIQVGYAVTTP